jgi:hypothetical protein
LPLCPLPAEMLGRIRDELVTVTNNVAAREIEKAVAGIEAFLAGRFYSWHVKLYRQRPIYWAFADRDSRTLVLHDFSTAEVLEKMIDRSCSTGFQPVPGDADRASRHGLVTRATSMPGGWVRFEDDGILLNLAPLADFTPEATLARKLHQTKSDLESARFAWSRTHAAMVNRGSTRGCALPRGRRSAVAGGSAKRR